MQELNAKSALALVAELRESAPSEELTRLHEWIAAMRVSEIGDTSNIRTNLVQDFAQTLRDNGIHEGRIAELGGPGNSVIHEFGDNYDKEHISLFPAEGTTVADVAFSEHVPDESFDAVFSISVFEHVSHPWLAAEQIKRILKEGGVTFHMAPFSYFFHGAPADYWRFTPNAFELLFSGLRTVRAEFRGGNRRRDNRGSPNNPVDKDGGEQFAVDGFGGWRENWHSVYAGVKDTEYGNAIVEQARFQVMVDCTKGLLVRGYTEDEAFRMTSKLLERSVVLADGTVRSVADVPGSEPDKTMSPDVVRHIWYTRGKMRVKVSYQRFVLAARAIHLAEQGA